MHERRKAQRSRCYLGGRIVFDQRFLDVECLVRNLSQTGARLIFDHHPALPKDFTLHIPQRNEQRTASIIWFGEREAGVTFSRPGHIQPDRNNIVSLDFHREVRADATQQAVLAKRIAQIVGRDDA